jgi:ABC-type dipeptide/oligopeptide/nickel transport system permease component
MTRAAMQEILQSDFIRTARAKGLLDLRNALLPVVTVLGLDFGSYLTGSILTGTIFFDKRDLPAGQGSILFFNMVFVMVNLVTDILHAKVDPRVAHD